MVRLPILRPLVALAALFGLGLPAAAFAQAANAPGSTADAPVPRTQSLADVQARLTAFDSASAAGKTAEASALKAEIAAFFEALVPAQGHRASAYFEGLLSLATTIRQTAPANRDAVRRATEQASALAQAGLRAEGFDSAQWAIQTAASRAVAQMGARFAAGTDTLAKAVRDRQDLLDRWKAQDAALLAALAASDAGARSRADAARTELAQLDQAIATLDGRLAREFPQYAALANPRPVSIPETQALLRPDEALVLFLVGPDGTYIWAVSRDGAAWARSDANSARIAELVSTLRRQLDPTGGGLRAAESDYGEEISSGAKGFDRATAFALYRELFPSGIEAVVSGKPKLLVVTSGALTSLPLGVLVMSPPAGGDADPQALRDTTWLGLTKAITVLPSVASLRALRVFQARAGAKQAFRGFGAPTLLGRAGLAQADGTPAPDATRGVSTFFRGAGADVESVRRLEPLPQTAGELKKLATALKVGDAALTTGDAFTETNVRRAKLDDVRVLAFATHGLLAGELQGLAEPALVLTPPKTATPTDDGLLTASEISQLRLAAEWVVLSACNTAAGDTPGAEGLSGLARAFFYAGARALLVSHWPVRDDAAARLTTQAIDNLNADPTIGRAEAFRRSMRTLLDDTTDNTLAHPSSWAPFELVGEGQ